MEELIRRFKDGGRTIRIVAAGSSNTERPLWIGNAQNWVDWFDLGLSLRYGRKHVTINAGISGETSRQILARFAEDVELFRPHLVIITCGGNDSNPEKAISPEEYRANLQEMLARCRALPDCRALLQTYYAVDVDRMRVEGNAKWAERFPAYMRAVREEAAAGGAALADHFSRWERLRRHDLALYRSLMLDCLHLNAAGHHLLGLDLLRRFGVSPLPEWGDVCAEALRLQRLLDDLPE